ncbi:MAG: Holliday junction resolvase RuvX [Fuerstiella sp.]
MTDVKPVDLSPDEDLPVKGRLLGIDFGTKRVGVSVSDSRQSLSSPLHNYDRSSHEADRQFFKRACEDYEVVGLVMGLPVHMSGDESKKSKEVRQYAKLVIKWTDLPLVFQDERFSSSRAGALLMQAQMSAKQRKARMDKLAAQILLQDFLDAKRNADEADVVPE